MHELFSLILGDGEGQQVRDAIRSDSVLPWCIVIVSLGTSWVFWEVAVLS